MDTQKLTCYRINRLPDFLTAKYTSMYGGEVRAKVIEAQQAFLLMLHTLESEGGDLGASIKYVYDPEAPAGQRTSIYLIFRNDLGFDNEKLRNIIQNSRLGVFYPFISKTRKIGIIEQISVEDMPEDVLNPCKFEYAIEITKEEAYFDSILTRYEIIDENLKDSPFNKVPYYFVYPFEPADDNDMTFIDRQFYSFSKKAVIEINISPTKIKTSESTALTKVLSALEDISSASGISINTSSVQKTPIPKDVIAEMVQEKLREMQGTAFSQQFFLFAIRIFADDINYALSFADIMAISGNKNGRYRKFVAKKGSNDFNQIVRFSGDMEPLTPILWNEYWSKVPEGFKTFHELKRLHRLASLKELVPFFRLMIPGSEPLQTIPLETESAFSQGKGSVAIDIGHDYFKPHRLINIDIDQLKKHLFLSGVPGSGKTTAILNLLFQLYYAEIPFLVFEPAKTEYRGLKKLSGLDEKVPEGMDEATYNTGRVLGRDLRVYTVGNDLVSPFRFNPFEFPKGISLYEHISNLESCFRGAMPISTGPLPALINEATEEIYKDRGWSGDDTDDGTKSFPTMKDLYEKISRIFETKGYSSDVKGDLKTAIEVRLGALIKRNIGRVLNAEKSKPSIEDLLNKPVVIELDYLNEEQANLMTMFILSRIREYVKVNRLSKSELKHVIVMEEAHNIVGKTDEGRGEDQANPKAEATKFITRFLAEMRALGEGLVIADQLPSAVAPEVVKNTNIKWIHRLVSGDDRQDIGVTMLMDGIQMEDLARLLPGESYLFQEGMFKPVRMQDIYIANTFPVLAEPPPDQREMVELLHGDAWWSENIFSEPVLVVERIHALCLRMEEKYRELLDSSVSVDRSDKDSIGESICEIGEVISGFESEYEEVIEKASSIQKLMEQRSQDCWNLYKEKFMPGVLMAQEDVCSQFARLNCLRDLLADDYGTAVE